jgi:large subunit ribosomal protein L2
MYNYFINKVKKQLIVGFSNRAGKNFFGRKTIFTQGGGLKFKIRLIDFRRNFTTNNILLLIEKDINRTGLLGLICSSTGLFSYVLLSGKDHIESETLIRGFSAFNRVGSSSFLKTIPTGNIVSQIEYIPSRKCKLSRAAGTSSFLISRDNNYSFLKMNSGWLLKLSNFCICVSGSVSNENHYITRISNAGKKRHLGFKPTVRGIAKNPCDHPHGGGEGRGSPPRAQRTPWGKLTKVPTKTTKRHYLKKRQFKIFKKKI